MNDKSYEDYMREVLGYEELNRQEIDTAYPRIHNNGRRGI